MFTFIIALLVHVLLILIYSYLSSVFLKPYKFTLEDLLRMRTTWLFAPIVIFFSTVIIYSFPNLGIIPLLLMFLPVGVILGILMGFWPFGFITEGLGIRNLDLPYPGFCLDACSRDGLYGKINVVLNSTFSSIYASSLYQSIIFNWKLINICLIVVLVAGYALFLIKIKKINSILLYFIAIFVLIFMVVYSIGSVVDLSQAL
jgi:hypothetical protein